MVFSVDGGENGLRLANRQTFNGNDIESSKLIFGLRNFASVLIRSVNYSEYRAPRNVDLHSHG